MLGYSSMMHFVNYGHLDCLNEIDLFCLHFVFLPRINATLQSFIESWNNHAVSSARNFTPNQLFIQGALEQNMVPTIPTHLAAPDASPHVYPAYRDHVQVPTSTFTPCRMLKQQLDTINCLERSRNFGCDIYLQVVDLVGQHLSTGCINCAD